MQMRSLISTDKNLGAGLKLLLLFPILILDLNLILPCFNR